MNEAARRYWDAKIREWARSSYGDKERAGIGSQPGEAVPRALPKRVMAWLRRSVDARLETATALLAPVVAGLRILELGCGTGELARRLVAAGAASVEGWDISGEAVALARQRIEAAGMGGRATFVETDIGDAAMPEVDLACGLGMLDWITLEEVDRLAGRLRCRWVLFSFSEEDRSFSEWVHRLYLVNRLKRQKLGFGAHHFRRDSVLDIFARHGWPEAKILKTRAMRFGVILHDLPPASGRRAAGG